MNELYNSNHSNKWTRLRQLQKGAMEEAQHTQYFQAKTLVDGTGIINLETHFLEQF